MLTKIVQSEQLEKLFTYIYYYLYISDREYFNFHHKTSEHIELKKAGLYGMRTIPLFLDDTLTVWSLIIFISILSFVYFCILHVIQFHKSLEFHLSITRHISLFPYAFIHPRSRILSTVIYSFSVSNLWNSDININLVTALIL